MIEEKYKTFWRRFWAGWIDSIVFIPVMIIDHFLWEAHARLPIFIFAIWYPTYYLSFYVYSVLMHGKYGQTLGKMATRVKVFDVSEKPLAMFQAIKRDIVIIAFTASSIIFELPKIISGVNIYDPNLPFDLSFYIITFSNMAWFLAEIITMLFNNKRRALHDFIAGSVVIRLSQQKNQSDKN